MKIDLQLSVGQRAFFRKDGRVASLTVNSLVVFADRRINEGNPKVIYYGTYKGSFMALHAGVYAKKKDVPQESSTWVTGVGIRMPQDIL